MGVLRRRVQRDVNDSPPSWINVRLFVEGKGERGMGTNSTGEAAGWFLDFAPLCGLTGNSLGFPAVFCFIKSSMAAVLGGDRWAKQNIYQSFSAKLFCSIYLHFIVCYVFLCRSQGKFKLDRLFLKRFWRCLKVMFPGWLAPSTVLFVLLLGVSLAGIYSEPCIMQTTKNVELWLNFVSSMQQQSSTFVHVFPFGGRGKDLDGSGGRDRISANPV